MRIMIGIAHPKQVHFWRNIINNLGEDGHEVKIVAWKKDITLYLLNVYGFKYEIIGKNYKGLMKKAYGLLESDFKTFKVARRFKPDILLAGSPALAHVSKLLRKPYIYFIDTEHAGMAYRLTYLFSDVICTPSCFKKEIRSMKHVTFNGYMELAYLHPNYFRPDASVLDALGLSKDDKFIIVRFVSWSASHDIGDRGFTNKEKVIKSLEKYGQILITSEGKLSSKLEKYKITIAPEKIHHVLYFASLYIGESAPMAAESAILGTPAIFVSTSKRGYTDELESKHGLVYNFSEPKTMEKCALEKAFELLESENTKREWRKKRREMLKEKIDVTAFMTNFIENYPESFYKYIQMRRC